MPTDTPSRPEGVELTVKFTVCGRNFLGLNCGPKFKPNESVSFVILTDDQGETEGPFWASKKNVAGRTYSFTPTPRRLHPLHVRADGSDVLGLSGFTRSYGILRHFWSGEMSGEMASPGRDPRGAADLDSLWTILDLTPAGRDAIWYPKLDDPTCNDQVVFGAPRSLSGRIRDGGNGQIMMMIFQTRAGIHV